MTSDAIVARCCDLIDERGSADFWWAMEADEILRGTGLEGQNLRWRFDLISSLSCDSLRNVGFLKERDSGWLNG